MTVTDDRTAYDVDGDVYLRVCTDITIYWRGSMFDRAEGLRRCYEQAIDLIGPRVTFYETETMGRAKKAGPDTLGLFPFWLSRPQAKRTMFMLQLESGVRANEPSDAGLFVCAIERGDTRVGVFRVVLPYEFGRDQPEALRTLTTNLVASLEFESGHAGYGVNWDPRGGTDAEAKQGMARLARRLPGVDLNNLNVTLVALRMSAGPAIKCVNWLTMLGTPLLDRWSGEAELQEEVGPTVDVHPTPTGAVLQAGPRPERGGGPEDRERLEPYHAVGRALAGLRLADHKPIFSGGQDATDEWLARFDA